MTGASASGPDPGRSDCFDFGGIPVALTSASADWSDLLRPRYEPFACDRPPRYRIAYSVDDPRPPSPELLHDARQRPVEVHRQGSRLTVDGAAFRIELDRETGSGKMSGPLATYPIDFLVQTLWYELVTDGLIFHAAALADDRRGWLLCGPSGAGKSTLAGLFPERALCDELAGVRAGSGCAGGAPAVTALPFWSGRRGTEPLAGIYLLRHDRRNHRRRLDARTACERLRRQVVWPASDETALRRAFAAFFDLLERVPVWELGFRPETTVWSVIAQEADA